MSATFRFLETPIGWLKIEGNETAVTKIWFAEPEPPSSDCPPNSAIEKAMLQLREYFNGERTTFDFPMTLNGTDFQQKVWEALRHIPYGHTRSYGDIAKSFHQPNLSRAIGMANGKNPIGIVIPCHRVIGENGKLTGYAGGLWRKQWLLEHESKTTAPKLF